MPCYPYVCDACGLKHDEIVPMSQYQSKIPCPTCGAMMSRTFGHAIHSPETPFQHPIEMFSVAPGNPAELAAFRKANPDVRLNDQLVPIARSRAEKDRILKSMGYEDKN